MKYGAILPPRDTEKILARLQTIRRLTTDLRIREQCRMIYCSIKMAERRAARQNKKEKKV